MPLINLHEYQSAAKKILAKEVFDFIHSGSDDQISREQNELAFRRLYLLPRVLVNVSKISTNSHFLNFSFNSPIIIAPTAFHCLVHKEGEIATAKAAEATGTLMIVSTMANHTLEHIKENVTNAWFQLYAYKDRSITKNLVERAEKAGYSALVLTVDCPLMGNREDDQRNGFKLPKNYTAANFSDQLGDISYHSKGSTVEAYTNNNFDSSFTWEDLKWLKSISKLPIVLKGVLHPQDAELALQYGISALIISNHGGRQIDTAIPTIEILPHIAKKINGRIPILIDGGIRRGTDIIKALSLGATAVLIGRPILWGLSVDGQKGVENVIKILKKELTLNMSLCGHTSIEDIHSKGKSAIYKTESTPPALRAKL